MSVRTDVINLNVNVNGNAAQNELNNLKKRAADVKLEMEGLGKRTKEFADKKKELGEITTAMTALKQQIGITALSQKELVAELNKLNALKGSVVPFSKEFNDLQKQIDGVKDRLYDVKNGAQGFASFFSKISDQVKQFGVVAAGYLGFQFLTSQFKNIIQGAGQMSDQLADLRRVTGLSAAEVQNLNAQLSKIDTRTSTTQLREIAKVAGMLGVSKDDILGFVKATDMLSVALGDELGSVDQITSSLGKILNVFDGKITAENITHLGNAVVDLSNKGVATGGFMVDFTQRLSGIAKTANISLSAILGFGAGIEETGGRVESGATAIQKIILKIGEDVPAAAKIAGAKTKEEIDKFVDLFAKAPEQAILQYAKGLQANKATFSEITAAFKDAGEDGARVVTTLSTLGQRSEFFQQKITDAGKAMQDTNEIQNAFALKNETFGATLDKLGKQFYGLVSGLSGVLQSAVNGLVSFVNVLRNIPQFIEENRTAIILLTGAFLAHLAVVSKTAQATILNSAATFLNTINEKAALLIKRALTAAQAAYGLVVDLVTGKITLATIAQRIWNNVIKANPLATIIVAATAVVGIISALTNKVHEMTLAQKLNAEIQTKAAEATSEQVNKVKILSDVINDTNGSLANRKKALEQLIALNPQYLGGLTLENIKTAEGKKLIDQYVGSLVQKAEAEAKYSILVEKQRMKEADFAKIRASYQARGQNISDTEIESYARTATKQTKDQSFFGLTDDRKLAGVNLTDLTNNLDAITILQKGVTDAAKKNVEVALGGVSTIVKTSNVVTLESLEKQKKDLEDARLQIDITNTKSLQKNKADTEKIQAEIDRINGKKSAGEKKSDHDYDKELKDADKFYKDLLKLREKAGLKALPQDDAEIEAVRQKYAELIARAKEFYIKKAIDKKKFDEEGKLIEEAQQVEIDALIKKHVEKRFTEDAEKEYEQSLADSAAYFDKQKIQAAQAFADDKITKVQYEQTLKQLDADALSDRITIATDYSEHVKKAATDVTTFKKEQEKQTTQNLIDETNRRKELADSEKLAKAERNVITAKGKGVDAEVQAKKSLLQLQFELDTQYLDKKSELYQLKEAQLQDAIATADKEGLQKKIDNVMQYVGYFSSALTSINAIINNKENQQLADEKKHNDDKKKGLKKQLDDKLISQAQYDKKIQELDDAQTKRENEVKRQQAIRQKALSIFNAVISNAQAIVTTMSSVPFPFNIPLAIAQGIAGGLQIAAIKNEPLPELGTGDWIRSGDKHKDKSGGIPVKIERDEAVMNAAAMTDSDVVTATGTTAQITSALNSRKGRGVAWAGGALVTVPKWRSEPSAQINPGLVRYMATGGLGSGDTDSASSATMDETNTLIRQLIQKQDENTSEIKNMKTRIHAVVSIKEYREEEAKYDAAKNASSIAS